MTQVDSQADQYIGQCFNALAKAADTPVSLSCWLMYKYGEFEQLARKDIDPHDYNCPLTWERDYLITKYLSKYIGLKTGIDTEQVALDSWKATESQCQESNHRLRNASSLAGVESVMFTAQRKIAALLGPLKVARVLERCKWGPGSTFTLKGESACLDDKIREFPISVTRRALPYIKALIESDPHWLDAIVFPDGDNRVSGPLSLLPCCFTVVRGCRGTLVNKSAKTKRSIAIEPTANIFLQLGVGREFRRCLRRVGVDLEKGQEHNRRLARLASVTGEDATLDLKNASNTVCAELPWKLFPFDWSLFMDQIRSPEIQWDKGNWQKLNMFSSMGNGFTFELESIIFWALTSSCMEVLGVKGNIGIYGDDIICPVSCVPLLREVLQYCGFTINTEKSYDSSYFRESCGGHFYGGRDCTPVYQKEIPSTLPELYRLANRLYRYALQNDISDFACGRGWVRGAWRVARRASAVHFVLQTRNDGHKVNLSKLNDDDLLLHSIKRGLHVVPLRDPSDDGLMLPLRHLQHAILAVQDRGWKLPVLSFRPKRRNAHGLSLLAYSLRFGTDEPFTGRVAVRRRGKFITRRRWFYPTAWGASPLALDVDVE